MSGELKKIDAVIIPVGGYGTRMGETTRAVPKALLPVGEKPLVVHAIDEALEAGINRIIIACRPEDVSLFNRQFEIDEGRQEIIKQNGRESLLEADDFLKGGSKIEIVAIYDKMGPASTIAKLVEDRGIGAFAVILPDDLLLAKPSAMSQMVDSFSNNGGVTTVGSRFASLERENPKNSTFIKTEVDSNGNHITTSVQIKPADDSPISKEATCGRYIFDENYAKAVQECDTTGMKEVSMSAIVRHYAKQSPVSVVPFVNAKYFDCGDKEGYMRAQGAFIPAGLLKELFLSAHDNVAVLDISKNEISVSPNKLRLAGEDFDDNHPSL